MPSTRLGSQADWPLVSSKITANLGAANVNFAGWVVPYSDLGYPQQNTAQDYTGPKNPDGNSWLVDQAASTYQSVFVEDSIRNGIANERYRWDLGGNITQAQFTAGIKADLAAGYLNKWISLGKQERGPSLRRGPLSSSSGSHRAIRPINDRLVAGFSSEQDVRNNVSSLISSHRAVP